MNLEEKLKAKVIDEQLYYISKGGQKHHCFNLLSLEDALSICQQEIDKACKKQRAYKHGIDVLAQEIERQERKWNESCKSYRETKAEEFRQASEHYSTKLRWFKSALKIIDSNIDFYLKHTDLFDKESPSPKENK